MADFILLMHDDGDRGERGASLAPWEAYFERLKAAGAFQGGSSVGDGACMNKTGKDVPITTHIAGYIRVCADDLEQAKALVPGNPVYESGGTVEVRELPRS